jgi:hypothetical protein
MENSFTRISDLPTGNNPVNKPHEMPNNYVPINIHPNPYGISDKNPIIEMPQNATAQMPQLPRNNQLSDIDISQINTQPPQRLPSRDIQHDTSEYSHDERVQPNYIPKARDLDDYVREHEKSTEKNLREYEDKKRRRNTIDGIITDIQTPVFIAILFFIFQMPIINKIVFKRFSFLSIYNDDGNFNLYGLLLKSISFGSVYYAMVQFTTFISEF